MSEILHQGPAVMWLACGGREITNGTTRIRILEMSKATHERAEEAISGMLIQWPDEKIRAGCKYLVARQIDDAVRSSMHGLITRLNDSGFWWLIGKGRSRPDEPLYGCVLQQPEVDGATIARTEGDDLVECIERALLLQTDQVPDPADELRSAITVLARAHTRDDAVVGFTVSPSADLLEIDQEEYVKAWETVRKALHMQTVPEAGNAP